MQAEVGIEPRAEAAKRECDAADGWLRLVPAVYSEWLTAVERRQWQVLLVKIQNMRELAAVVRTERKPLGLSQSAIAERTGTSRGWIVALAESIPHTAADVADAL